MSKRIAVLASGTGSNTQALLDACADGRIAGEVAVIATNRPTAGVLDLARAAGVPALMVDHRSFDRREEFDRALLEALMPFEPDLVALAGFMRILTPEFLAPLRGRLLNIHPSLLPRYTGLDTHARAIAAGDREGGATVHFVTDELDGGPPLIQARVAIENNDTVATLSGRVLALEHIIYPTAVEWCLSGRARLTSAGAELDDRLLPASGYLYQAGQDDQVRREVR